MIRPLDLSDLRVAERVVEIQRAAYRVEAGLIGFDGIPALHESVHDVRAHDLSWRGAFVGDVIAGIVGWRVEGGCCDIDRLAVDPGFARRGHGRCLVATLLHHPAVVVSTGTLNLPARRLYESLGFVACGEREVAAGVTVTRYERCRRLADDPDPAAGSAVW